MTPVKLFLTIVQNTVKTATKAAPFHPPWWDFHFCSFCWNHRQVEEAVKAAHPPVPFT